jgi:UDP-N-acetylmuramate--alanine ligase
VVTNIDREHMDFFKNMDTLKGAFLSFINKVPFYGLSILCWENDYIRELLPKVHRRFLTYGFSDDADIVANNLRKGFMSVTFDVTFKEQNLGSFFVPMPGSHSVLNCLASIAASLELKVGIEQIREALKGFRGIQRRFEFKGEAGGVRFFDDYGHHPAEIRSTLRAAKESLTGSGAKDGRLVVLFQPHRYTRTRDLIKEFGSSFQDADVLCITDIYAAGEKPIEGVNPQALLQAIKDNGHADVTYVAVRDSLMNILARKLRRDDLFITIGAGDVWKICEELLKRMKGNA